MPLRAVCCFAHLTSCEGRWNDSHYCVKKFLDALKGRPIWGWADIPVGPGARRRLEDVNAGEAIEWFGEMAADILRSCPLDDVPILVPIPSSKCDTTVRAAKTSLLATAITARIPATVLDIVRFDSPQPSVNGEGGTRDAADTYAHLRLVGPVIQGRPYVLIDDVLTSGAHLMATAALLRRQGVEVPLAVCGVLAGKSPSAAPFARVWRTLGDLKL